jgi:FkbM family methyltransferase
MREKAILHVIGTPVEPPLRWVRGTRYAVQRLRQPEWGSLYDEGDAILRILEKVIKPTSNCIDVGCHLGSMLAPICRLAPDGKHMAFEPTPYKADWLQKKYPHVDVRREALGDLNGEAEFFHQVDYSGFSGLRPIENEDWNVRVLKVMCARLDDVIDSRKVDFIKIDVEGGEPLVIRGAARILRQSRPALVFECAISGLRRFDWTPEQMYAMLCEEFGYDIFIVHDWLAGRPALTLEGFIKAMSFPAQAFNFFAVQRT